MADAATGSDGGDRDPGLAVDAEVDRSASAGRFDSSVAPPPREPNAATSLPTCVFEETGEERTVVKVCAICKPDLDRAYIVSPAGVAHHGSDYGMTDCGHDATGPDWWWPL